jgi:murein DD-endopeptidase MepM/ murein hydrolase activator NlpD
MLGQRYAYDFIRLDPARWSHYFPGGIARLLIRGVDTRACYGWGEPIHSPLDGEVVVAVDGVAERRWIHPVREIAVVLKNALTFRPTPEALRRVMGNHVIVRSQDVHAAFAHLAPGSVRVAAGQRVRVGDVLGRVGHTGNSTAPHLHFQLMDAPDPLVARGVPCAFRAYEVATADGWRLATDSIPTATERIRSVPVGPA